MKFLSLKKKKKLRMPKNKELSLEFQIPNHAVFLGCQLKLKRTKLQISKST